MNFIRNNKSIIELEPSALCDVNSKICKNSEKGNYCCFP